MGSQAGVGSFTKENNYYLMTLNPDGLKEIQLAKEEGGRIEEVRGRKPRYCGAEEEENFVI